MTPGDPAVQSRGRAACPAFAQLKGTLGKPMLWHAHNLFVGQILQTGAIGLALFWHC